MYCQARRGSGHPSRTGLCDGAATMGTKLSFIKRFEKMGIKYKRSLQKCLYRCEGIIVLLSCNG